MKSILSLALLAAVATAAPSPQQLTFNDHVESTLRMAGPIIDHSKAAAKDIFGQVKKAEKWAVEGLVRQFDEVTTEGITYELVTHEDYPQYQIRLK
ncbi:hypothetical protein P7C70_g6695, partial [Phenoliferia sp. Uapishka_3]